MLSTDKLGIHSITSYHNGNGSFRVWNGTCFISYVLYSTPELHSEFYSSPKISMIPTPTRDSFKSPDGAMTKFAKAIAKKKIAKIVVFIELLLPAKFFYRPFERRVTFMIQKHCFDIPKNIDNDFRFDFLKRGDFSINCPDGIMPCNRMALYLSSKFMKKYLTDFKEVQYDTVHFMDVVEPVITFLHSSCFEMPETYDLNFAKRLLEVINIFNPQESYKIKG
uniref:BTB domain-containing protein n=1 Tax=Panagrolaimus sp. ES5 TaxID=591445 RepID=A0AC34GG94_9BILA